VYFCASIKLNCRDKDWRAAGIIRVYKNFTRFMIMVDALRQLFYFPRAARSRKKVAAVSFIHSRPPEVICTATFKIYKIFGCGRPQQKGVSRTHANAEEEKRKYVRRVSVKCGDFYDSLASLGKHDRREIRPFIWRETLKRNRVALLINEPRVHFQPFRRLVLFSIRSVTFLKYVGDLRGNNETENCQGLFGLTWALEGILQF